LFVVSSFVGRVPRLDDSLPMRVSSLLVAGDALELKPTVYDLPLVGVVFALTMTVAVLTLCSPMEVLKPFVRRWLRRSKVGDESAPLLPERRRRQSDDDDVESGTTTEKGYLLLLEARPHRSAVESAEHVVFAATRAFFVYLTLFLGLVLSVWFYDAWLSTQRRRLTALAAWCFVWMQPWRYLLAAVYAYPRLDEDPLIDGRRRTRADVFENDPKFLARIGAVVPCHKSEEEIGATLRALLRFLKPEHICVVDNANFEEPPDGTRRVCESVDRKIQYRYVPCGLKITALWEGVRSLPAACSHVLLIDDDTILAEKMVFDESIFLENPRVVAVRFPRRTPIPDDSTSGPRLWASWDYARNDLFSYCQSEYAGTHNFIDGVLGLYDRQKWLAAADRHEALDFGEDAYLGLTTLLYGLGTMVAETRCCATSFTPPSFFGCVSCASGKKRREQGYGAASLCKQRTFRWVVTNVRRKLQLLKLIFARQRTFAEELGVVKAQLFMLVQIVDTLDTWLRLACILLVVNGVADALRGAKKNGFGGAFDDDGVAAATRIVVLGLAYVLYVCLRTALYFFYYFRGTLLELPAHPNILPSTETKTTEKKPCERGWKMYVWAVLGDLWYAFALVFGTWHAIFYTVPWVLDRKGLLGGLDPDVSLATHVHCGTAVARPPRPLGQATKHPRYEINSYRRYNIRRYALSALVLFAITASAMALRPSLAATLDEWHFFLVTFILVAASPLAFKLTSAMV